MPTIPASDRSAGTASRSRAIRDGLLAGSGLVTGVVPLGIALGVALAETAAPRPVAWATAPLLIAGASQLVLLTHLDAGATVVAAVLAAVLVNARFVVYGAALAHRFVDQPTWFRWLGPWFVVDQTYSIITVASANGRLDGGPTTFRRFYLAAALLLSAAWSTAVGIGIVLGPVLPEQLPLEFVLAAMFVALVVPGLRTRREHAAAIGGVAVGAAVTGSAALAVAALAGAISAVVPRPGARP